MTSVNVRILAPRQDPKIPSICAVIPGAVLYERELQEMFGVVVDGIPDGRRLNLPDSEPKPSQPGLSMRERTGAYFSLVAGYPNFLHFSAKRVVYLFGTLLATPLFPLYYVRVAEAPDAWIGYINTAQTIVLLVGYSLWTRQSRRRGSRFVLLTATLGLSIYPALVASTTNLTFIVIIVGLAGIFQAGIDLVFIDELMKTVPDQYSATFVSLAQSFQHFFGSSISGVSASPGLGMYVASKHAVVGMTRSAVLDYAEKDIRINAICPGFIRTDMTRGTDETWLRRRVPIRRGIEPEEIAGIVLFLCSDAAASITGQAIVADGGATLRAG